MAFTDADLNNVKKVLAIWKTGAEDDDTFYLTIGLTEKMIARLEAAERIREFAGAPKHEEWLKAENAWLKASGK